MLSAHDSLKTVTKGAGIVFLSLFISKLLTYLYRMVVARVGTEEYGTLSIGLALLSMVTALSTMGLSAAVLRYIPYYVGKKDEAGVRGTIISALKLVFPVSVFFGLAMFVSSSWISINLFHNNDLIPVLTFFSIILPLSALSLVALISLVGFKRIEYYAFTKNVVEAVVRISFLLVFLYLGYGLTGAAFAFVLGIVATFLLSFYFLERVFPFIRKKAAAISLKRELLSYSWPLVFYGQMGVVVASTDVLMIGYFLSTFQVGVYSAALPTAELMFIVPGALLSLFLPVMTEHYARNENKELEVVYQTSTRWVFYLNLPAFLLLAVFSAKILKIFFGEEYVAGATSLSILALGYLIASLSHTAQNVLNMVKRTKLVLGLSLVVLATNVSLNYVLIPVYGIVGGAMATGASLAIGGLLYLYFGYCYIRIQPLNTYYVKGLVAGSISILVVERLTRVLFTPVPLYALVVMSALFIALYFLLLLLLKGFPEEDVMIIKTIQKKTGIDFTPINKVLKRFL